MGVSCYSQLICHLIFYEKNDPRLNLEPASSLSSFVDVKRSMTPPNSEAHPKAFSSTLDLFEATLRSLPAKFQQKPFWNEGKLIYWVQSLGTALPSVPDKLIIIMIKCRWIPTFVIVFVMQSKLDSTEKHYLCDAGDQPERREIDAHMQCFCSTSSQQENGKRSCSKQVLYLVRVFLNSYESLN